MNKFREIRIMILGISARVFSKIIGSNICSVYNWEKGLTSPRSKKIDKRISNLIKLFEILKKDPDFLDNVVDNK